jgi:hypothetical protein
MPFLFFLLLVVNRPGKTFNTINMRGAGAQCPSAFSSREKNGRFPRSKQLAKGCFVARKQHA